MNPMCLVAKVCRGREKTRILGIATSALTEYHSETGQSLVDHLKAVNFISKGSSFLYRGCNARKYIRNLNIVKEPGDVDYVYNAATSNDAVNLLT